VPASRALASVTHVQPVIANARGEHQHLETGDVLSLHTPSHNTQVITSNY